MTLPDIPLPLEVPFEIPLLIHPVVAHFGITIPVFILIVELINLYYKRPALSVTSLLMTVVMIGIFVVLFLTGTTDGKESYIMLSEAGQHELKEHKILGVYLVYGSLLLAAVKGLSMLMHGTMTRGLFFIVLLGFIGLNMLQGKHGGELVYQYGANVTAANEAKDAADDLQYEIEDLQEEIAALEAEAEKGVDEKAKEILDEQLDKAIEAVKEVFAPDANSSESVSEEPTLEEPAQAVENNTTV